MDWISVNERLPENDGKYLAVYQSSFGNILYITIKHYSSDLYEVDDFDFSKYKGKKQDGWYGYDSEAGYYEVTDSITHWMPLPKLPLDK